MKKLLTLLVALVLTFGAVAALPACSETGSGEEKPFIGLIALHDSNSTYDKNFIDAFNAACEAKGVVGSVKTGIPEDNKCYDTAAELADAGCKVVFADSFGHESFLLKAAKEFTDVQFCHATGTTAHTENLSNFHNAFASIYEGRYLAGVVAGLKLKAMMEADSTVQPKVGYVGAFTYAEVISGYTSWYLGVKSIVPAVEMQVQFTGSWYDETAEKTAAEELIKKGCVLISQHADSMGAPTACETANVPNVSYNGSTEASCPNTFLISSRINWQPYFEYIIDCVKKNETIVTDYVGGFGTGYTDGSVAMTELGKIAPVAGTQAKIDEVAAALKAGTLKVFDVSTFTVEGKTLTSYKADVNTDADYTPDTEVIKTENGITYFAESEFRSAPYFNIQIDGITLLNTKF